MIHYTHPNRILVALDCIIFGFDGEEIKLLLIKRNFEPEQGKWSLMGGFLNEEEDLEVAANRILYTLTGLTNNYLEQLQTFGAVNRDPVERTISVVYYALVNIQDQDVAAIRTHNASWIGLNVKPKLIFDHDKMVEQALRQLRYKAALHAIGFELLPEKFTIPQLQKLYEAIYNRQLDRRNFSRKILSTDLLVATGEKDTTSATKKGQLFRLNTEKYQQYLTDYVSFFPELTLT
ncbi:MULTISPECIES: NUDIX domain-containing protein [unclassified Spirosoma]|uniref:NUDIX hydrolase n=1 Tax=unclassified Spirosoma TaxID=2621999 RepID=UPI000968504D|nr:MULTISPECIES: NUDIX domain-containing protein [unclassified Spirosoma]MBN8820987.1 NUDIX hydrolase [Spirosoma sp.]OJW75992.1 MAG: DNA mismatch repair protein MutT [Spirosoma sp. 48-14]